MPIIRQGELHIGEETRTEHSWDSNAEVDEVHQIALPRED